MKINPEIMSTPSYQLPLEYSQLLAVVKQLKASDKLKLLKTLQGDTFKLKFKKLLSSLKTDQLSLDDITKEVEAVRQQRYEQK